MEKTEDPRPNLVMEALKLRRTLVLSGEINRDSMRVLSEQLISLQMISNDRINLIIDSGGGETSPALTFCDLLSALITAPVRGIALGSCGSAATFVMLHCNERVSTPYSRFVIHSGMVSQISVPINQTTSVDLEQLLLKVKATEEKVIRLYMNRLTPPAWKKSQPKEAEKREFVRKLIERGDQRFNDVLSAEEAIQVGLVTEIIREKLDIYAES